MKKNINLFLLLSSLIFTNISQAASYEYSYSFRNGEVVSGIFNGDLNGNLITNLSGMTINISLPYRPPASFLGNEPLSSFKALKGISWDIEKGGVASLDGKRNSFAFVDPNNSLNFLYAYSLGELEDNAIMLRRDNENIFLSDSYKVDNWKVSLIPEASHFSMLLAGLTLIGLIGNRRRIASLVNSKH